MRTDFEAFAASGETVDEETSPCLAGQRVERHRSGQRQLQRSLWTPIQSINQSIIFAFILNSYFEFIFAFILNSFCIHSFKQSFIHAFVTSVNQRTREVISPIDWLVLSSSDCFRSFRNSGSAKRTTKHNCRAICRVKRTVFVCLFIHLFGCLFVCSVD